MQRRNEGTRGLSAVALCAALCAASRAQCPQGFEDFGYDVLRGEVRAAVEFDFGQGPEAVLAGGYFDSFGEGDPLVGFARYTGSGFRGLPTTPFAGSDLRALAVYDSGSGPELYCGGSFTMLGGSSVSNIAKWDGTQWVPVGAGFNNAVNALCVWDDGSGPKLVAGGVFTASGATTVNKIAKWDGSAWSTIMTGGGGFPTIAGSGAVNALAVGDVDGPGTLYVAGTFSQAVNPGFGTVSAARIVRLAPGASAWQAMPTLNIVGNQAIGAFALCVADVGTGPAVYLGGNFGGLFPRLARWNGAVWDGPWGGATPSGTSSVNALAKRTVAGVTEVFVGGAFTGFGAATGYNRVARITATGLTTAGLGFSGPTGFASIPTNVRCFATLGSEFFAAGRLYEAIAAPGVPLVAPFARWNATAGEWAAVTQPPVPPTTVVASMAHVPTGPLAGVYYARAEGATQFRVVRRVGIQETPLGGLFDGAVKLAAQQTPAGWRLYAAGAFTTIGGAPYDRFARWNGSAWENVGGLNGEVTAISALDDPVDGPQVVLGGDFATAGGTAASGVVRYDADTGWHALGALSNGVNATTEGFVFYSGALHAYGFYFEGFPSNGYGMKTYDPMTGVWNTHLDCVGGVSDAVAFGGLLFLAGGFIDGSYVAVPFGVRTFDGAFWSIPSDTLPPGPAALEVFDDGSGPMLYCAGAQFLDLGETIYCYGLCRKPIGGNFQTVPGFTTTLASPLAGTTMLLGGDDFSGAGSQLFLGPTYASYGPRIPRLRPSQPGGPGTPAYLEFFGLVPGRRYLTAIAFEACPGGVGTGPILGLCFSDPMLLSVELALMDANVPPFGQIATYGYRLVGPWTLPAGMHLEARSIDFTGFDLSCVGDIATFDVQ